MHSVPFAEKQKTICSGWIEGADHCKHGHVQTFSCNPYINPKTKEWTPKTIPVCLDEESKFNIDS